MTTVEDTNGQRRKTITVTYYETGFGGGQATCRRTVLGGGMVEYEANIVDGYRDLGDGEWEASVLCHVTWDGTFSTMLVQTPDRVVPMRIDQAVCTAKQFTAATIAAYEACDTVWT